MGPMLQEPPWIVMIRRNVISNPADVTATNGNALGEARWMNALPGAGDLKAAPGPLLEVDAT